MPEIGYRYNVDNEELDKLIQIAKLNHPVAILEKLFCMNGEKKEHFDYLNEETIVSEWDIGRVFDINSEIRWEKDEDKFHVIWIINNGNLTSEWKCEELRFKVNRRILLWGEKIENQEGWYEKQIPKIFKYPVNGEKNRVYIDVDEYNILSDGSTVYKFKGLTNE
jgi:hypothetical protein